MRKIFVFIMLSVCLGIQAQRVDKPGEPYDYYIDAAVLGGEIKIFFTGKDLTRKHYILTDDNKDVIVFWSLAEFMTYMSKRGWEIVNSSIPEGRIILKKKVFNDSEAFQFLNIETYPYKKPKKKE